MHIMHLLGQKAAQNNAGQTSHFAVDGVQWKLQLLRILVAVCCMFALLAPAQAHAFVPTSKPPAPGSYGLEATKSMPAPKTGPTITTPGNGSSFSTSPITVSGLCGKDLLVQVYNNGVLVGAVDCQGGSFRMQVTLFSGKNELTAIQYEYLDQASPVSNKITVTYNNAHFDAFGELITLTSNYGRRAANPGSTLTWPLLLSGGNGPYAFSIDWGDGKPAELMSQPQAGEVKIQHVYDQSGIYHVTVRVTDKNGVSAFLQVVAVANGKPTAGAGKTSNGSVIITRIIWLPALICFLLLFPAYWLGRRSELVSIRKKLERDLQNYNEM